MYLPNFLNGFDRLVAFDAETTGKRTPDAEFIRKQPFAWRAPGIIIEVGFVEMLREVEGWRKGETWSSRVNPDGPIDPEAIKIHRIRPADLKNPPRFPTTLPKVKDFVGELPIVAHAYKNERNFLDFEFARAKAIEWARAPTLRSATFARRSCSRSFSQAPASRLPRCAIGWCSTAAKETAGTAHCFVGMTADALILLERQLKHGESGAPRSWTST